MIREVVANYAPDVAAGCMITVKEQKTTFHLLVALLFLRPVEIYSHPLAAFTERGTPRCEAGQTSVPDNIEIWVKMEPLISACDDITFRYCLRDEHAIKRIAVILGCWKTR